MIKCYKLICSNVTCSDISCHMQLRAKQDEERKQLLAARDRIRNDMGIMVGKSHGPAQVDPNQCTDMTEKFGYLGKRPDNALRLPRRQWPKKYCSVSMQGFTIANSHVSGHQWDSVSMQYMYRLLCSIYKDTCINQTCFCRLFPLICKPVQ